MRQPELEQDKFEVIRIETAQNDVNNDNFD
jgi:hypothetical protein